jgi:hypothetical protein
MFVLVHLHLHCFRPKPIIRLLSSTQPQPSTDILDTFLRCFWLEEFSFFTDRANFSHSEFFGPNHALEAFFPAETTFRSSEKNVVTLKSWCFSVILFAQNFHVCILSMFSDSLGSRSLMTSIDLVSCSSLSTALTLVSNCLVLASIPGHFTGELVSELDLASIAILHTSLTVPGNPYLISWFVIQRCSSADRISRFRPSPFVMTDSPMVIDLSSLFINPIVSSQRGVMSRRLGVILMVREPCSHFIHGISFQGISYGT